MWQEARKQGKSFSLIISQIFKSDISVKKLINNKFQLKKKIEKILRGIMVDYKRRAERRKGFYDKIV